MAIIAVSKVYPAVKVAHVVRQLVQVIKGTYKVLDVRAGPKGTKTCIVEIEDRLDPEKTCEVINRMTKFHAYVPSETIEDKAGSSTFKQPEYVKPNKRVTRGQARAFKRATKASNKNCPTTAEGFAAQTFLLCFEELLGELQSKFCGLYSLSQRTNHKLIDNLGMIILDRMKQTMELTPDCVQTGFRLSQQYRKLNPHFGDFQMILSTLHKIEDEMGMPHTDITEADLTSPVSHPLMIGKVPLNKVQSICAKYINKINKKLQEHMETLKSESISDEDEAAAAKKQVREHLINMSPYFTQIVSQVINNHFIPDKSPFHRIRMYGEPFMPNRDIVAPLLKRFQAVMFFRSDRMYNMLRFNVPLQRYNALMKLDGTVVGGAKLIIRSSDAPRYIPKHFRSDVATLFGIETDDKDMDVQDDDKYTDLDMPNNETECIDDLEDY